MHPNPRFQAGDREAMLTEAAALGFARLFATTPEGPRVAHAPMLRAGDCLRFHLANANDLCRTIDGTRALALFEGPNGYLSANWYGDVRGAVPTWNYVAVECEGPVRRLDRSALVDLLDSLAAIFEQRVGEDWTRNKMDPARFERMLSMITPFEITVEAVRATHKLSQNQPENEAVRVIDGFERSGQLHMAAAVRAARI